MKKDIFKNVNFVFHFISQISEAINDNTLRQIAVLFVTYHLQSYETTLTALITFLMVLPFVLFSRTAGKIADKYENKTVALYVKFSEIFILMFFFIAYSYHNLLFILFAVFFMGVHSAFFSPVKMSLIKKLSDHNQISQANSYIQGSTYLAVLVGTVLAKLFRISEFYIAIVMLIIALIALIATYLIELKENKVSDDIKINFHPIKDIIDSIKNTFEKSDLTITILGITAANFITGALLSILPFIVKGYLGGNETVFTIIAFFCTLGIILGTLVNTSQVQKQPTEKHIFLSLFSLGFLTAICVYILHDKTYISNVNALMSPIEFFANIQNIIYLTIFTFIGFLLATLVIPLHLNIQLISSKTEIGRNVATQNTFSSTFGTLLSAFIIMLFSNILHFDTKLILVLINVKIFFAAYLFYTKINNSILIPQFIIRGFVGIILSCFRISITGIENVENNKNKKIIYIANHISYLDGLLIIYAVGSNDVIPIISKTFLERKPLIATFLRAFGFEFYTVDEKNAMAIKEVGKLITEENKQILIFPEGRITCNGILMKMFNGPAKVANDTKADIIPIYLDGPQRSYFSLTNDRKALFPKFYIVFKEPISLQNIPEFENSRDKLQHITQLMYDVISDMNAETVLNNSSTLFQSLINEHKNGNYSKKLFCNLDTYLVGGGISISDILVKSIILGTEIKKIESYKKNQTIGIMMASDPAAMVLFYSLLYGKFTVAILNFTAGVQTIKDCIHTAQVKSIYTSRKFIQKAKLENLIQELSTVCYIIYLEDINPMDPKNRNFLQRQMIKVRGLFAYFAPQQFYHPDNANNPAVVLFTSGSVDKPKAVNLSHRNLQANIAQIVSRLDTNAEDKLFHALPIFHSFGLITMLFAVRNNIRTLFFPDPKDSTNIPNVMYGWDATILFSTNTFLKRYGENAHQYDFYSLRYVFAGAEKLEESTRQLYFEKFGIRILEGYGATEASPIISVCTNMHFKINSVGRFLPLISYKIEPVPGIDIGGELVIKGPNVMLGYTEYSKPGKISYLSELTDGWYNTGDIVTVDNKGFISIIGRTKRFAKIAGEMISLEVCENIIKKTFSDLEVACLSLKDENGEIIVALSTKEIDRQMIILTCTHMKFSNLHIPKIFFTVKELIKFPTGKTNYIAMTDLAKELMKNSN